MKPADFLAFAKTIAATPSAGAAAYRSSISRAYYAVYLQARDWLRSLGITIKGANEHRRLQILLMESKVDLAFQLARSLESLQNNRTEADYDLHLIHPDRQKTAQIVVELAEQAEALIAQCADVSTAPLIAAGIHAYKAKTNQ